MVSAASSALPAELSLPQSDLDRLDLPEQSDLQELSSPAVSVGSSASLLEALELPARLEALAKCDAAVTPYDPDSFRIVFALEGRNADAIVWPLALLLIWGIVAASILEAVPGLRDSLVPIEDVFSPLLTTISFLLVFRLGRAAVRYWDARAAAGKMVEICRVLASDSAVACAALPELRAEFATWLALFPIVVKNFLRPTTSDCVRTREMVPLVTEAEARALLDAERTCAPIFVLNRDRKSVV